MISHQYLLIFFAIFSITSCSTSSIFNNRQLASSSRSCDDIYEMIMDNAFNTHRDIDEYENMFGFGFTDKIYGLQKDDHWIDSGAGDGNAIYDFFEDLIVDVKVTGVVVKTSKLAKKTLKHLQADSRKIQWMDKRYIEDIPLEDLEKADLITDLYGPFSYTDNVSAVLKKYLQLLKKDGELYIYYNPFRTTIHLKNGESLNLSEWLESIDGIEVRVRDKIDFGNKVASVKIKLNDINAAENIPNMKQIKTEFDKPPRRVFKIIE